jgi:hypothetical protein
MRIRERLQSICRTREGEAASIRRMRKEGIREVSIFGTAFFGNLLKKVSAI